MESTKYNTKCNSTDNKSFINKNMFEFNYIIGKGGFGKVWRVKYKKTKEIFALKEMSKRKIIDKKSVKSINNERVFLSKLHHPFLVNMHFAFQDQDNLYLVIDILNGGDLRFHCSRYRIFSEEQTRFFIACLVHTLAYIHKNNVMHRDIKPENIILDDKGYLHITDFGIAKENNEDNSSETSGTPGYMAPEVMKGLGHSFSVDYFAIGIIGYEFMLGKRPYNGKNRKEIKEQMFTIQAKIERNEIAKGWSLESRDFINKLLRRKPEQRLGSVDGIQELKEHYWLKYYPWKELENRTLPGPFIPEKRDNFDKKYCEGIDKISENTKLRYEEIAKSNSYKTAFINFYFNKEDNIKNNQININSNLNNNNNNLSYSGKNLICYITNNINSPISTNGITILVSNKNIRLKKSENIKESNNIYYINYQGIHNNLYKKVNQRPFSSNNRIKKERIKKSSSQKLYKKLKNCDKSLYSLLNSNSCFIPVIKKSDKNNMIKNKIEQNLNVNKDTINKNNSFSIDIVKSLKFQNNYIINKVFKNYNANNKQLISFLQNNSTRNNNHIYHRNNSELFIFKNIRNKILYKQIYRNNISNNNKYIYNQRRLFKLYKRNNSFLLNKKNKNNLDLSSIRLFNQKNNSIINNRICHKIINYQIKGNQTARKDNDNFSIFPEKKDIEKDNLNL